MKTPDNKGFYAKECACPILCQNLVWEPWK